MSMNKQLLVHIRSYIGYNISGFLHIQVFFTLMTKQMKVIFMHSSRSSIKNNDFCT